MSGVGWRHGRRTMVGWGSLMQSTATLMATIAAVESPKDGVGAECNTQLTQRCVLVVSVTGWKVSTVALVSL